MLQVTFRGLLPSEELLALAKEWYGSVGRTARRAERACCNVTIIRLAEQYRATLEMDVGATCVLRVVVEESDPLTALCKGIRSAHAESPGLCAAPRSRAVQVVAANGQRCSGID